MGDFWRPNHKQIIEAKTALGMISKPWARTRLRIVEAIERDPQARDQLIAGNAGTRTSVLKDMLANWRTRGTKALIDFGRPKDLDEHILKELKSSIQNGSLRSLKDVETWVVNRTEVVFSAPTIRRYCRSIGANLPSRLKQQDVPVPKYKWTDAQKAELKYWTPVLGPRAAALLKLGCEKISVKDAAETYGVNVRRLRRDLQYFLIGKLKEMIEHNRPTDILTEIGKQTVFFDWCDDEFVLTQKSPAAESAKQFIEGEFGIKMPLRSVYTHLARWKMARGIRARAYKRTIT